MDLFNYSSSPFIPGFDIGNMSSFMPETMLANNENRRKLIEQRSKVNNDSSGNTNKEKVDLSDYKALEFLNFSNKNEKEGGGESVLDGIIKDILDKNKKKKDGEDMDYGKMTEYAKDVIDKVDEVARDARGHEFLRQGIGTFVTAPAVVGESALRSAEVLNRLAIANMGAMAAQNSVLASNPTKLQIAGKYFRS